MNQPERNSNRTSFVLARAGGALALLLAFALLLAAPAQATYETVGTFGEGEADTALKETRGAAVNVSGVGGVPAGTLYTVAGPGGTGGVNRFSAKGELIGHWGLDSANGVAVDQATGYVYVLRDANSGQKDVHVYSADGSELITEFGEASAFAESIEESPEKIHASFFSGIAVDDSGLVYISDINGHGKFESRVMVFEPESPGDYEHYVYAGRGRDIAYSKGGDPTEYSPRPIAVDSAGNIYFGNIRGGVYEFAPGEPDAPACEYEVPGGAQLYSVTVNPENGAPFVFDRKKQVHQLSACNQAGEFEERGTFTPQPKPERIDALAFNPALAWEASRPSGVLYGVDIGGLGYAFAPAEVLYPVVESESVSAVTSTTAVLGAQINPKGSETRYAFQYLTEAEYEANEPAERFAGATEAPLGGAVLGSGQQALGAGATLLGLAPDTAYRYRVLATSHCEPDDEEALCEDAGPAQAFRTFPTEAPGLPDNRAWELVSPAQKYGGEVFPITREGSCSECKPGSTAVRFPLQVSSDGEAVVYEGQPLSLTEGAIKENEYISRRTPSGWQTTFLSPALLAPGSGHVAFNADLSEGLLRQSSPSLTADAPSEFENLYRQPTADPLALAPLLTEAPPNRAPTTFPAFNLTYAGSSADFSRQIFEANDALTSETPFAPAAVDPPKPAEESNLYEWAGGQLSLVNVLPDGTTIPGAVFGSGTLLKAGNPTPCCIAKVVDGAISADGQRIFWTSKAGQLYVREDGEATVEIEDGGKFIAASADGSRVLLNDGCLYELETKACTDLTQAKGGFEGIAGRDEGLSRIYFVDTAVLTGEEENEHGAKAQSGGHNLYAWQGGTTSFIATLVSGDNGEPNGDWQASPAVRSAEASPDGRWLAFQSLAPLSGYDNTGLCGFTSKQEKVSAPCAEVFLYDSASGQLSCPSCNPSGLAPLGRSTLGAPINARGTTPQLRYLSDSGRLFFDSQDSLTPFDTNHGVEDVYEYEPEGIGTCKRAGGCVRLISAGSEPVDSNFLAADASGKNVFFTTRDQLVLKDRDDLIDLYVAREDGGIASETETSRGECQGEACVPALSPPNDPTPGSSSFEGAGNVDEKKAAKKHKHKKHAKKAHHKRAASHNRGGAK